MKWLSRLRVQLAAAAFLAVYVPVVILLGVVLVADVTTVIDGEIVQVESRPSRWVFVTAAALAPVAVAAAWAVAGRAVAPIRLITEVTDDIQATDLARRIELNSAQTEVRELADSFNRMIGRLEAASDAQRRFIEDVSHELRTPLAVISTNADVTLANPSQDLAIYRESVLRTKRNVARLGRLVDELLRGARDQARQLDRQRTDLAQTVTDTVAGWEQTAAAGNIQLVSEVPGSLVLDFEPQSVERVVTNLLDNAIRHSTPPASVDVRVGATPRWAWCRVADEGTGIPQEDHERIFERFWRAEMDDQGLGLGLAISRQVAEAHGGVLTLTSQPELGACFILWLPRKTDVSVTEITADGIHHLTDPTS